MIGDFDFSLLVKPLMQWFYKHARILPWRDNPTPYRVWISEIMLQQTRVEAVKPYYERFMKKLPDVKALAECSDDTLMKLWEGLGYYNRARNLKIAANQVISEYGGTIPDSYEALLKLKGIGQYTAGAVASIAYGKKVPAVDGNVLRVICRVSADTSDIMKQSVRSRIAEKLRILMEQDSQVVPSVFNQALMELGAIVCVPNGEPLCEKCPLEEICQAHKRGLTAQIPVKKKAKKRRIEERTVLLVRCGEKIAIHKREQKGLLAGLYEFPGYDSYAEASQISADLENRGYRVIDVEKITDAKHIFSHVEWKMRGYEVEVETIPECDITIQEDSWLFVEKQELQNHYAIPSAFAKYMEYLKRK